MFVLDAIWGGLQWLGKIVVWIGAKFWALLNWAYFGLIPFVGEAGALVIMFMILFFPVLIIFVRFINTSQSGIEDFSKGTMGLALKVFGVFVVFVLILFVLSEA